MVTGVTKLTQDNKFIFWRSSHRKCSSCKSYDIDIENIFDDQVSKLQKLSSHQKFQSCKSCKSYQVIKNFKVAKVIKSSKISKLQKLSSHQNIKSSKISKLQKLSSHRNVTKMRARSCGNWCNEIQRKCNWDARGRMVTGVTKFKGNVTEMRARSCGNWCNEIQRKCNWDARGRMVTGVTKFKENVTEMRARSCGYDLVTGVTKLTQDNKFIFWRSSYQKCSSCKSYQVIENFKVAKVIKSSKC
jgi:hypothetical protein